MQLKKSLKLLAKDTVVYGFAALLNKSITLITFPLLTRYFSVEEFGELDFLFITLGLLVIFVGCGQDSAIFRYYNECSNEKQKKN